MRLTSCPNDPYRQLDNQLLLSARTPVDSWSSGALEQQLADIHNSRGTEFATAWLYQTLNQHPTHGAFIQSFTSAMDEALPASLPLTVCVVPGAFYREYPRVDSSGQALRAELRARGVDTELIPVQSTGTLEENARIIRHFLRERSDQPLALISLSKGGADIKVALQQSMHDFKHVRLWYSISGTLSGAELVSWVQRRWWARTMASLVARLARRDPKFFSDMGHTDHGLLHGPLVCPSDMTIVHVAGFALARHTRTRMARTWYRRLERLGPTDSMILLRDLLQLPGYLLPVWGVDHYWKSSEAVRRLACGFIQHADHLSRRPLAENLETQNSPDKKLSDKNALSLEHSR